MIGSSKKLASPFPKAELTKRSKFLIKNFRYFLEPPAACYGNISIAWNKKKDQKNNVRFETEAWNDSEIAHCGDTFYLRVTCPGSSLCLVIERPWEWGCLLTRGFRRRHSCDMCCSHISDVTYWQWHLNHIWHNTFKHAPNKLKKRRYIFKNHHHHNIMSGLW